MKYLVALDPNLYADNAAAVAAITTTGAGIVNNYAFNLTFEIEATAEQFDSLAGVLMSQDSSVSVNVKLQIANTDHLRYCTGTPSNPKPWLPITTGAGEYVYLVDTGVKKSHEEFTEADITDLWSNFTNDPSISLYDDEAGHGTAVASLIVGLRQGTAKSATLYNLKLFNQNNGNITIGEIINALNAVLYHHNGNLLSKAKTVCLPWVIPQNNFVDAKINEMNENNLIVVCAAGNDGSDVNLYSPAGVTNVITCGAYDRNYNVSSFTNAPWGSTGTTGFVNYGAELDIFALGVDIDVAAITGTNDYATLSGTSLAAGIVAGIASHYTSRYPTKNAKELKDIILAEGHFSGTNMLVFDNSNANVNYNLVNKSIITTDNTDTAQIATTPSGRLLNVQVGTSAIANIGLNPGVTEVGTLDFAPAPPFISFDVSTGIVSVNATGLDPAVQVPGVYLFAIKGKINNGVAVEEYSVGLYTTSEDELASSSQYYYDADANEYDSVVSYQVAPNLYSGGGPKP
jgi:subtilisin family serine protease